ARHKRDQRRHGATSPSGLRQSDEEPGVVRGPSNRRSRITSGRPEPCPFRAIPASGFPEAMRLEPVEIGAAGITRGGAGDAGGASTRVSRATLIRLRFRQTRPHFASTTPLLEASMGKPIVVLLSSAAFAALAANSASVMPGWIEIPEI